MMARKDYEAIARILKAAEALPPGSTLWPMAQAITYIVEELANYMEYDNPNFQRTRFLEACKGE